MARGGIGVWKENRRLTRPAFSRTSAGLNPSICAVGLSLFCIRLTPALSLRSPPAQNSADVMSTPSESPAPAPSPQPLISFRRNPRGGGCFVAGSRPLIGVHKILDSLYGDAERCAGVWDDRHNLTRGQAVAPDLKTWLDLGGTEEALIRGRPRIGPGAEQVARLVLKAGWIPRRVELPVGHAVLGIGTAVDLFCTNAQGQAILIEVKVAGSANWQENAFKQLTLIVGQDAATGQPITRAYGYTARLRAFLQLLMTRLLFEKTFPTIPVGGCFVIHVAFGVHGPRTVSADLHPSPEGWMEAVGKFDMIPKLLGRLEAVKGKTERVKKGSKKGSKGAGDGVQTAPRPAPTPRTRKS